LKAEVEEAQLFKWLKAKNAARAVKVLQVRRELTKWLPQVREFFLHYPSHGTDHSDRIVQQLSHLLFNKTKPVVQFSTAEVYCLLCAAYLHDIGMVVSPGDASAILASEQWKSFVATGGKGQEPYQKYVKLRDGPERGSKDLSAFLTAQSLRYLIADFVRRDHHERGKTTLELHPYLRQLVDDGDSVAFDTIADIGVGHGLRDSDLLDGSRFPEERLVFGEKVNVRFLARLLRIGDLLDMSSKRADPMTERSVGPLPLDAVPHWQQYSAKKHENISPKVIEFTFECRDQDAHRVLRDWFGWLETEIRTAGLEQLHAARHDNWKAPRCIVSSQAAPDARGAQHQHTIVIKPAARAQYRFHDWKLELDHEQILQRLIHDVYDEPIVFVRELIQNALDATRCQMYRDFEMQNAGATAPDRPTQFPPEFRERYPVTVSLTEECVKLSPDGPTEKRQVFTIEDCGTGMNEEIIRRYFLQIGRSYYQSNEFRERYKFAPTSRFGIGFLSVFAVSRDITVDTAQRDDATGEVGGIRLRLREPRNYLLTEPWTPFQERAIGIRTGTRIRLVLADWSLKASLITLVQQWCVAVEVPILVKDVGEEAIIRQDVLVDETVLAGSRVDPEARFLLRTFNVDSGGVEGQVGVVAYRDSEGEGWCDCWSRKVDLGGNRLDLLPDFGSSYTAFHGVSLTASTAGRRSPKNEQWIRRVDIRSGAATVPLARAYHERRGMLDDASDVMSLAGAAIQVTAQAAVERHLETSQRAKNAQGVYYAGKVLSGAPVGDPWRDRFARTSITWKNGRRNDVCGIACAQRIGARSLVYSRRQLAILR
jgi:molecular chaperone HtpG